MPCLIRECTNPVYSRGYCHKHYQYLLRDGYLKRKTAKNQKQTCLAEGCDATAAVKGYCRKHYQKYVRGTL